MITLGNRNIKFSQPVLQTAQNDSFFLERVGVGKKNVEGQQADVHQGDSKEGRRFFLHTTSAATFSMTNASITSPFLMSLNLSRPMPHSKPERTSEASSLKR